MGKSFEYHRLSVSGEDGSAMQVSITEVVASQECFDPDTCCDCHESAMIKSLRLYLRPQQAPSSLIDKLEAVLDRCCDETDIIGESANDIAGEAAVAGEDVTIDENGTVNETAANTARNTAATD